MKQAEEIIKNSGGFESFDSYNAIIQLIDEVQTEAYNEAINEVLNITDWDFAEDCNKVYISKDSIIQLLKP